MLYKVFDVFFLQGTVANKFYVHNDVFRYQDEVFGDSDSEPQEGERTPLFNSFMRHQVSLLFFSCCLFIFTTDMFLISILFGL